VPIETACAAGTTCRALLVAFTPKGGCPLKQRITTQLGNQRKHNSIHPQGWVPIETCALRRSAMSRIVSSIHPQGWVPIETRRYRSAVPSAGTSSIHSQGWVPIETRCAVFRVGRCRAVAFTPKGGCPLKLRGVAGVVMPGPVELVAFTPKGGCPLKRLQLRIRHAPLWARVAFTPKGGCPLKRVDFSRCDGIQPL